MKYYATIHRQSKSYHLAEGYKDWCTNNIDGAWEVEDSTCIVFATRYDRALFIDEWWPWPEEHYKYNVKGNL